MALRSMNTSVSFDNRTALATYVKETLGSLLRENTDITSVSITITTQEKSGVSSANIVIA